jgi:hypothetical protein
MEGRGEGSDGHIGCVWSLSRTASRACLVPELEMPDVRQNLTESYDNNPMKKGMNCKVTQNRVMLEAPAKWPNTSHGEVTCQRQP